MKNFENIENIHHNIPLKLHTSYKIGGNASYFCEISSYKQLSLILQQTEENNIPLFIIGYGTNILADDSGYNGIILKIASELLGISINDNFIEVKAGEKLDDLIDHCSNLGFSGLEELAGIPGTLGGAIFMNAGAFNTEIKDIVTSVTSMNSSGKLITRNCSELEFDYRTSIFKTNNEIILEIKLKLNKADPSKIKLSVEEIRNKRNTKQPLDFPSCGSVFKRPPNNFAGTLIEKSNFKGFKIGGAEVSTKHSNFILNKNNASSKDIKDIIKTIIETVEQDSGIKLEREVIYL